MYALIVDYVLSVCVSVVMCVSNTYEISAYTREKQITTGRLPTHSPPEHYITLPASSQHKHNTSHHITSHHITTQHYTSHHHITSHHITRLGAVTQVLANQPHHIAIQATTTTTIAIGMLSSTHTVMSTMPATPYHDVIVNHRHHYCYYCYYCYCRHHHQHRDSDFVASPPHAPRRPVGRHPLQRHQQRLNLQPTQTTLMLEQCCVIVAQCMLHG